MVLAFTTCLIILLILGTWQLERLIWKNTLLNNISYQLSLPPIIFNHNVINNIEKYKNRKIKITGKFFYNKSITIYSRVHEGEVGRDLIIPFKTKFGWVMVNSGFIPEKNFSDYLKTGYSKPVLIEGVIQLFSTKGYFTPENNLKTGEWYYLNLGEIMKYVNLPLLDFVIIESDNKDSKEYPISGQYRYKNIPNDHLKYAFTWFSLAVVLFVIMRNFWSKSLRR